MPFVRRQRKYYKDGVEVPSSSITDFGSYKYFKNVVTTKYWKEVTTGSRELAYACWKSNVGAEYDTTYTKSTTPVIGDYAYGKIGENIFGVGKPATSPDQLGSTENFNATRLTTSNNITTNSFRIDVALIGSAQWVTYYRYPEGDLYIDTTVTETVEGTPEDYTYTTEEIVPVEVTADDDYDYTEFVPSTQFDNYEDKNMMYQFTKNNKQYNLVYKNKIY